MADVLAKTLASHLANGEIYFVSNSVHNFELSGAFSKVAVTDSKLKIIYISSAEQGEGSYYKVIDPKKFSNQWTIIQ
jgi:hypothetical protein